MSPLPSLSVVLPVHNGEKLLGKRIAKLLDILPDLTGEFEILVVDDGSTDHTNEVAHEIAREYPQIGIATHQARLGKTGIMETAMALASGEVLFVQDENAPIDSSKFHRLWSTRTEVGYAIPFRRFRDKPAVMKQLASWGIDTQTPQPTGPTFGLQIIRRRTHAPSRGVAPHTKAIGSRRNASASHWTEELAFSND